MYIYFGLTLACAIAYWLAGMDLFDAVAHSFSTVAIGGFSTHDASMGYFDNKAIEIVAIVFMFLGAINFALNFSVVRSKSLMPYFRDSEFKLYASLLVIISSLSI